MLDVQPQFYKYPVSRSCGYSGNKLQIMGADGGIKITKVSEIKTNWKQIKENLIKWFEQGLNRCDNWEKKFLQEYLDKSKELPNEINNLSGEEICKLFQYLAYCDCPYLYEDAIITAEGDNVASQMETLSMSLNGISIETWT